MNIERSFDSSIDFNSSFTFFEPVPNPKGIKKDFILTESASDHLPALIKSEIPIVDDSE